MSTVKAKIKTIILGDQSTGKTSIITRFISHKFSQGLGPTIGIDFLSRNISVQGSQFRIQLWDTAGQERFRSLIPSYLKDASIVIIVFDVSNRKSFENLTVWVQLYREFRTEKSFCLIVGNKVDLPRQVSKQEAQEKAKELETLYIETSAKTANNIDFLFTEAVKQWKQNLYTGTANTIVTQYDMFNSVVVNGNSDGETGEPENKTSILGIDKFQLAGGEQGKSKQGKRKCC